MPAAEARKAEDASDDTRLIIIIIIIIITRPHCLHAVHGMRPIGQMSHVAWSVRLCVLGTRVNCAKTYEAIEMPFGG